MTPGNTRALRCQVRFVGRFGTLNGFSVFYGGAVAASPEGRCALRSGQQTSNSASACVRDFQGAEFAFVPEGFTPSLLAVE